MPVTMPAMTKTLRRGIIAALLCVVAAAVFGLTRLPQGSSAQPSAELVPRVHPEANEQTPQQGQIRIEMPAGWTGRLTVDQKAIPDSQLTRNQDPQTASHLVLTFQPGPLKVLEYFVGGQNCASFTYWQIASGESQSFVKSWCFTAV